MKQAKYASGMIPTTDDLDFEARSKNYSIEQSRYDLLIQYTTSPNDKVKGVVANSGMTSGFEDRPLQVYITTGDTASIYSGVGYDGFEGRSNRIWVPDDPADVPLTPAAAVSNYDNIDMPDEVQTRDFTTATRPPRTSVKAFTAADASGAWYVCIKFVTGDYDPIVIPSDGSQDDAKAYESYEISIAQLTAAQLYAADGDPWMQLATLNWDGAELTIVSDDRVFAGAISQLTDELLTTHQERYHDNAIISPQTSLLLPVIDNVNYRVNITNTAFTSGEGMNIQGSFLQDVLAPYYAQFNAAEDSSGYYWIYIDYQGYVRKTTVEDTAREGLVICQVYYDQPTPEIRRNATTDPLSYEPYDRRHFGTIAQRQLSNLILGGAWTERVDYTLEEAGDELVTHRWYEHGHGLVVDAWNVGTFIYAAGAGSLGASAAGTVVTVNDLSARDYLYVQGREIRERAGSGQVDFSAIAVAGTYLVYAQYPSVALWPSRQAYMLRAQLYSTPVSYWVYPICTVDWDPVGSTLSNLVDKRVYNTIGYAHTQRNSNAQQRNTLPQLLNWMNGSITGLGAGAVSSPIYLTDDWGPANYAGGGTVNGQAMFATRPIIFAYVYELGVGTGWSNILFGEDGTNGYSVLTVTNSVFRIRNQWGVSHDFAWAAVGPPFLNTLTAIEGRNNPTYD